MRKRSLKRAIGVGIAGIMLTVSTISFLPTVAVDSPTNSTVKASTVEGDVNGDGVFNISDVVDLQKWLLGVQDIKLNNWEAADLCNDGRLDVFDLCLLKKLYIASNQKTGDFYSLSSDMVHDNDSKFGTMVMSDEFYSKRVIVKATTDYDFSAFSTKDIISGPDNLYVLQFETVEKAELCMNALRKDEHIEYVELDEYMSCGEIEGQQTNANSWGVSTIEADQYAEYLSNTYNSSVVVAVVDTGVASHDFLKGRLLDTGYDLVDNDPDPNDKHYHGTHVAGTVVDCTPGLNIKIMPVRVLNEYGGGSNLNVGNGIRYATEHGANVINLSLGGEGCSKYIDDSIKYAVENGVTVVAAAGNEGDNTVHYCPAHLENCIIVAACDSDNKKAYFSNYGNSVDVIAPGVDIKSCIPGGSYKTLNGTSMATPHIAAAAAMIKYSDPNITPAEIEQKIKDVSIDLGDKGKDIYYGYGLPKLSGLMPSIFLSNKEISMVVGDNKQLTAQTIPSNQTVSWKSSNSKIVSVDNGNVKALAKGNAKITASFNYNGKSYNSECTVNVEELSIDFVVINSDPLKTKYNVGDTIDTTGLELKVYYNNNKSEIISSGFICSPNVCAEIGNQDIKVTYKDKLAGFFSIDVVQPTEYQSYDIDIGETVSIGWQSKYVDYISISNSNPNVATATTFGITGVKSGTTTITYKIIINGTTFATYVINVSVNSNNVPVTSFTINENTSVGRIDVAVGKTYQLSPTVYPSNATNKQIIWTSSNTDVATVDSNGVIHAVYPGYITLTGKAADGSGVTKTTKINVEFQSEVMSPGKTINMKVGESVYVTYIVRGLLSSTNFQPITNTIGLENGNPDAVVWDRSDFKTELYEYDGKYYTYLMTFKYDAVEKGSTREGCYGQESFCEYVTINVS